MKYEITMIISAPEGLTPGQVGERVMKLIETPDGYSVDYLHAAELGVKPWEIGVKP